MGDTKLYAVYAVDWTEYERGWGQRYDGTSLHKSKEAAEKAVKDYDAKNNNADTVPDCYTKGGRPYLKEVSKAVYDKVMRSKTSVYL